MPFYSCHNAKMQRTIIVRRNYLHFVKKYQRYEKRHSNIPAHVSPCFRVKEGDHVIHILATVKDGEVQRPEGHSSWELCIWEESIYWNVKKLSDFLKIFHAKR
ncbi:unnamed protein product, partial [Thlaspi arvense]